MLIAELQEPTDYSVICEWAGFPIDAEDAHLGLGWDAALGVLDLRRHEPVLHLPREAAEFFWADDVAEPAGRFGVLLVAEGEGELGGQPARAGDAFALPHGPNRSRSAAFASYAASRHGRPKRSTIAPSSRRRATDRSRSVVSASAFVHNARPASMPDAPPPHAASTARGKSAGSTPCESTTHGTGSAESISRAPARDLGAGRRVRRAAPGTCRATARPRRARARPRRSPPRVRLGHAHDRLEHRQEAVTPSELDEARAQLDPLGATVVVAPDHEQLQRDDARDSARRALPATCPRRGRRGSWSRPSTARISPVRTKGATAERARRRSGSPTRAARARGRPRALNRSYALVRRLGRARAASCGATRAGPSRPSRTCRRARARASSGRSRARGLDRARSPRRAWSWTMLAGHSGSKRRARAGARRPRASRAVQDEPERARVGDRPEADVTPSARAPRSATRSAETSPGCRGASSRRARTPGCVRDAEPGGMKATCPSDAPEASRNRSIPPAPAMRSSYAAGVVRVREPDLVAPGGRAARRARAPRSRGSCSARRSERPVTYSSIITTTSPRAGGAPASARYVVSRLRPPGQPSRNAPLARRVRRQDLAASASPERIGVGEDASLSRTAPAQLAQPRRSRAAALGGRPASSAASAAPSTGGSGRTTGRAPSAGQALHDRVEHEPLPPRSMPPPSTTSAVVAARGRGARARRAARSRPRAARTSARATASSPAAATTAARARRAAAPRQPPVVDRLADRGRRGEPEVRRAPPPRAPSPRRARPRRVRRGRAPRARARSAPPRSPVSQPSAG